MTENEPKRGEETAPTEELDVVVVGAGFAGIYMLHKLRQKGFRARVYEKGSDVGGTWFWNRYPGARCDVPSLEYSYSFSEELQQEWEWTEHHASQPEIERYAHHVVDRFDLRRDIQFDTSVTSAVYDEGAARWSVETDTGERVRARYCVMATGGYHTPIRPEIAGLDSFDGELYFTNQWPHEEVSFAGKRIGLIGTGSSGVQTATSLASEPVGQLVVFQRTPGYIVPSVDHPLDPEYQADYKATYAERRARSRMTGYGTDVTSAPIGEGRTVDLPEDEFQSRARTVWAIGGGAVQTMFPDFVVDERANYRVAEFLRTKIREIVDDPERAELLCAKSHYLGAKRIIIIDGYFDIFNQDNVSLVDLEKSPVEEVTPAGIRTTDATYPLDMIICATGFDSATGSMLQVDIRGREGQTLSEKWARGHRTYLGIGIEGFPNLFMIAQAGSPGIRSHVMVSIEQHVDWITDLFEFMRDRELGTAEPSKEAEDTWTAHVAEVASKTLLTVDDTQHLGSNVPGKPRVVTSYLGGVGPYRKICDAVRTNGYEGWALEGRAGRLPNNGGWSGPDGDSGWEERDAAVGRTAGII